MNVSTKSRAKKTNKFQLRHVNFKQCPISLTAIATALFALSACSTTPGGFISDDGEIVDDSFNTSASFSKRLYGSVGIGASRLDPDTSSSAVFDVDDRVEPGGQVTIGADLSKTFSVELHSADLGSAGLSPAGRINYQINGGSALLYAGADRRNRRGLSGYGRLGVAALDNSAVGNVQFDRANDTQILVGAGAEYGWRSGFGVRGEFMVFDEDAQFAQLGLIYRLGNNNSLPEPPINLPSTISQVPTTLPEPLPPAIAQAPATLPPQPSAAAQAPTTLPEPLPAVVAAPLAPPQIEETLAKYTADGDKDGISDTLDDCPGSDAVIAVDDSGCAVFNGIIDGVTFERGSARLTDTAIATLDSVINTLSEHPDALIAISAHTDNIGNDDANMALSRNRAIAVARHMIINGVPKNLMSATAFGELVPIADNQSSDGRARNRRVELVASRAIKQ